MSSPTMLRARIEEILLAMERQNQVLRDLEKRLSDARRDLNATLDPMARLPLEISSDIFVRCLPDSPRPHKREAPILFLNICRIWRHIAISTPSLWTSIALRHSNPISLELWLGRAKTLPLSIHGYLSPSAGFAVKQHARHIKDLELGLTQLTRMVEPLVAFSLLAKLVVQESDKQASHREFLEILRAAPALVECEFMPRIWNAESRSLAGTLLTHSSLRRLRLGGWSKPSSRNASCMLKYLTLPALEALKLGDMDLPTTELASFFTRSSPPLQSLSISGLSDHNLDESLRLVPSISDLGLTFTDSEVDPFVILKDSVFAPPEQGFLPNLAKIHIHASFSFDVDYNSVINALAARRAVTHAPLESFEFSSKNPKPRSDTIAAFRHLAKDSGLRIKVGTHMANYICDCEGVPIPPCSLCDPDSYARWQARRS
ncbi:F-box domain-containing protein [Mycena sanguinolenta]|uniref:F-box domain-containing protein n=1 Tax=Mycena sanguinolenta TaxID=230812 RepID=A0A8H7CRY4_9AGAR|nr:F-box domain-containing protein [Mycena sanguinolenta]